MDLGTLPRVDSFSDNEKKNHPHCEQNYGTIIEFGHLLMLVLPMDMELIVCEWMVHKLVQHKGHYGHDNTQVERPPPS